VKKEGTKAFKEKYLKKRSPVERKGRKVGTKKGLGR